MAVCYIDDFSTTLDAAITTASASLTLPSADAARIQAALEDDGPLIAGMEEHHFVPLVIASGSAIEIVRATRVSTATDVDVVRGASPISASIGDVVRCCPIADYASTGGRTFSAQTSELVFATPGAHIVSSATFSNDFYIRFNFFDGGFPTTDFLRHARLPAVVEIHNTTSNVRGVNLIPGGGSMTTRWIGGTPQLSIPADVLVAVYEFRLVYPDTSRANVGHMLAKADFYK